MRFSLFFSILIITLSSCKDEKNNNKQSEKQGSIYKEKANGLDRKIDQLYAKKLPEMERLKIVSQMLENSRKQQSGKLAYLNQKLKEINNSITLNPQRKQLLVALKMLEDRVSAENKKTQFVDLKLFEVNESIRTSGNL